MRQQPAEDNGLVINAEGDYKSREEIIYDSMEKGEPIYTGKVIENISFDDMVEEFTRRRDARLEFEGIPDNIEIIMPTDRPTVFCLMGDQHASATYLNYEMLRDHVNMVSSHPLVYSVMGGDLIDGAAFNPAQDDKLGSFREEALFARKMLDKMGGESILLACQGDHDMWAEKSGITMYQNFVERYNTPMVRGASRATIGWKDGVEYKFVFAHKLPGHSIYNKTHPQNRESKFGIQGADIYVGWHNHQKGLSQQVAKQADGNDILQTFAAPGAYKYSDSYSRKQGYSQQSEKELGAIWLVLHPYEKRVEAYWEMQSAIERVTPYLTGKLKSVKPPEKEELLNELAQSS